MELSGAGIPVEAVDRRETIQIGRKYKRTENGCNVKSGPEVQLRDRSAFLEDVRLCNKID